MNIEIKKLTPDMVDDYIRFFDDTPHSTNKPEHRCYCVCWCSDNYKNKDLSTAEKRRKAAAEYVKGGNIQGYLAYCEGKVIGWCNANTKSDCYECTAWQMFMGNIERDNANVKSVYCFTIAPEYRGKGVAGLLLEQVCRDAEKDGYEFVEGYPNREFINTEDDFMGPIKLFEKHGFIACYEADNKVVMRKKLG